MNGGERITAPCDSSTNPELVVLNNVWQLLKTILKTDMDKSIHLALSLFGEPLHPACEVAGVTPWLSEPT